MSQLTSKLMCRSRRRRSAIWPPVLKEVSSRLAEEYGTPSLGNYRDPVKEIFYILLSARTTETLYKRAHRRLFQRFPDLDHLAQATAPAVNQCINGAGLGQKRSAQIVRTAKMLRQDFGSTPHRKIRSLSPPDAFRYLTHLPGFGPKSALCVMMYSLDIDVFPVDVNVQRIAERIGTIRKGLKHYEAQQTLPKYVPTEKSKELHIGLVIHGRKICQPLRPKCDQCIIADLCRMGRKATSNGVKRSHGA